MSYIPAFYSANIFKSNRDINNALIVFVVIVVVLESIQISVFEIEFKPSIILMIFFICHYFLKAIEDKVLIIPPFTNLLLVYWSTGWLALIFGCVISMNDFIRTMLGQIVLILFYVAIYNYILKKTYVLKIIFSILILLGITCITLGVIQILAYWLVGSNIGIHHVEHLGFPRPSSIFSEPDWFGLYMGYCVLLSFTLTGKRKIFYITLFVIGIFISGARAPMFALLGVFLIWLFFARISFRLRLGVPILALIFSVLIIVVLPEPIQNRFNPFVSLSVDGGAADSRLYTMMLTYDYFLLNPLVGNGMGGLGEITEWDELRKEYASGGEFNTGRGGSNILLSTLFDVGLIGALPFFLFILLLIRRSIILISRDNFSFALAAGVIFILMECMINNIFRYTLVWLHLAMFSVYFKTAQGSHTNK